MAIYLLDEGLKDRPMADSYYEAGLLDEH